VAHDQIPVDAELLAELADLILEHLAQGLDEFELERDENLVSGFLSPKRRRWAWLVGRAAGVLRAAGYPLEAESQRMGTNTLRVSGNPPTLWCVLIVALGPALLLVSLAWA